MSSVTALWQEVFGEDWVSVTQTKNSIMPLWKFGLKQTASLMMLSLDPVFP